MLVRYRFVIIIVLVALAVWFVASSTGSDNDESVVSAEPMVDITAGNASVRWDIDTQPLERTQLAVCSYGGDMGEFFWYKAQELYGGEERVPYQNGKQVNFSGGYVQAANGVVTVFNRLADNGYHTLTADERAATIKKLLEELGLNAAEFTETAVSGSAEEGVVTSRRATVTLSQVVSGIAVEGGSLTLGFNGNYVESITAGYNQVVRVSVKTALTVEQLKQAFSTAVLSVTGGIEVPTSIIVSAYTTVYRQDNSQQGGGRLYPYIIFEGSVSDGEIHGKFYSQPILMLVNE